MFRLILKLWLSVRCSSGPRWPLRVGSLLQDMPHRATHKQGGSAGTSATLRQKPGTCSLTRAWEQALQACTVLDQVC